MKIPYTLSVISACWREAEENLQIDISENYPGVNEEFITQMFHGKLSKALKNASKEKRIESAFKHDLQVKFPEFDLLQFYELSNGLIADVVLHKRKTEAVTGGDIGLVINRPNIEMQKYRNILKVDFYRNGLLCQAKLKKPNGKWNLFTSSQKKRLSNRLNYLGLLLYEYDDTERRNLKPFQWQICNSTKDINDILNFLREDKFPSIMDSQQVINGIGNGKIGVDDDNIIDTIVAPMGNTSLEIIIKWLDDRKGGGSEIRIHSKNEIEEKIYVRLR